MEKKESSFAVDFLMGGVAAAVSKTAAAPIERIKLLLQNQPEMLKSGRLEKPYEGIVDCFKRVRAEEGTIALWRGNNANVIRYFPTQALNFAYKDQYKKLFAVPKKATYAEKFLSNVLAGGLAGATSQVFVYSLDYARTRLANDSKAVSKGGERQFKGIVDVYKKTLNTDGVAGLYRGFTISVVGITIYRGLYFGLYDSLKPTLSFLESNPVSLGFASFLLGWGVTIAASMACYPIDTVRRRMMMTSGETEKYKSSMHAFSEILKKGGVQALFSGAGANILRAVAGAGALAGYDQLQFLFLNKSYSAGSG